MIAMLRGLVAHAGADHLVLDVQGVGYKVHAPAPLRAGRAPGTALISAADAEAPSHLDPR